MATEEKKVEDLALHEQEDGSVVVGDPEPEVKEEETSGEDERLTQGADADEEGHAEETAEEAEARKERNRRRRLENKTRRKEYIESLQRELAARDSIINDLSSRVANVERSSTGNQMAQLDAAIAEAQEQYNQLRQINQQAIEQANGEVATEAQERMFAIRNRHAQLTGIKQNMLKQPQQPQPLDPRVKNHAQEWLDRNKWYDPSGSDMDSRLALTIDDQLHKEGWNPTTAEYWDELEARTKKYLPHRYNSSKDSSYNGMKPRTPVSGGGREASSGGNNGGSYKLSHDRVQALKDAGMWEDPVKRAEAIKRFQQYDKEQSRSATK